MAANGNGAMSGAVSRNSEVKIEMQKKQNGICHDDSAPPVKAQTIDELHSLQKKKFAPTTPINGAQCSFVTLSAEERQKRQLPSISASLASPRRGTGPKVVKGDPAKRIEGQKFAYVPHHHVEAPTISVSDSSLEFNRVLYNLSPAELYEQAIKCEKGSFITSTGALATFSGAKTGTSPGDKRVVEDEITGNDLWWEQGPPTIEMDKDAFMVQDFQWKNLTVVLRTRALTQSGIASGRVSASNGRFVEEMPRIEPGRNSRPFLASDMQGGHICHLKYNRRMSGLRPKQTITGLKRFFWEHGLQPGDRITLYKEEGNEVMLMGKLISPLYVIGLTKLQAGEDHAPLQAGDDHAP